MIKFDDAKNYLIEYCDRELISQDIEKTQKRYVCPFCNGGANENRTAPFRIVKQNPKHYKCDSCAAFGDVFNLIQETHNFEDQKQARTYFENYFNVKIDGRTIPKKAKNSHNNEIIHCAATSKHVHEYTKTDQLFNEMMQQYLYDASIKPQWALKELYKRGFTDATIKKYMIGFNPKLNRIILPFPNSDSYQMYNPNMQPKYDSCNTNNEIYNMDVLNDHKPVFVCEGIFDALSVAQCGFNAIALMGTGNQQTLIEWCKEHQYTTPLIFLFDLDAAAKQTELCKQLYKYQITIDCKLIQYMKQFHNSVGDPNECLIANTKSFGNQLKRNYDFACKQYFDIKGNFARNKK